MWGYEHTVHRRLRAGKRIWMAEFGFRLAVLIALTLCGWIARFMMRLVHQAPPNRQSPLEFLVAASAIVCLSAGLALLLEGPGLLRDVPKPPRALL
jgi:hypothetical protein